MESVVSVGSEIAKPKPINWQGVEKSAVVGVSGSLKSAGKRSPNIATSSGQGFSLYFPVQSDQLR